MARPLWRASATACAVVLVASLVAALAPTAAAQVDDPSEISYQFTLNEVVDGSDFLWSIDSLTLPAGAVVALRYDSTGASAQHNVHVTEGAEATPTATAILNPDEGANYLTLTMPESGTVEYICDVHPTTMVGHIEVGEFTAGGGGEEGVQVTEIGAHFLAHWVGVISFAAMFIIYGLTFFLFKYNESAFTTDHADRATPAGAGAGGEYGEPFLTSKNFAALVVILVFVVVAALVYLLQSGRLAA